MSKFQASGIPWRDKPHRPVQPSVRLTLAASGFSGMLRTLIGARVWWQQWGAAGYAGARVYFLFWSRWSA